MAVRALALDFDGVLTDGTLWWGINGEELKRLSFLDIMAVSLGRKAGLTFALISGEDSPVLDRFAAKMDIRDVFKSCKDKVAALRSFAEKNGFDLADVCYMGDDVNDLPAMRVAGLSAAPASAHESVKRVATIVTSRSGGRGAVRELVDEILSREGVRPS